MSYYPMFAFFEKTPQLDTLAEVFFHEFAVEFQEFGVIHNETVDGLSRNFKQADQALDYLKEACLPINELWCASDYDQIIVRKTSGGYVDIEFWDFDSNIYDEDGPSEALRQKKRALAIKLHAVLIEKCSASFCYTLASDSADAADDFLDTADEIVVILKQRNYQLLDNFLRKKLCVWLAGLRIGGDIYKSISEVVSQYFQEVDSSVFEHRDNQPYFMS